MLPELLSLLLAILPAAEGPCAGDWRGVALNKALADVGRRCGVKYLADASLPAEAMDREVRLSVRHLTGQQTARWLARIAGLDAVEVEGSLVLAAPKRAKLIAQELSPEDAARRSRADASAWRNLKTRHAAVNWDQTPLSRVANDASASFGVDVIYHPDLLSEPLLITMSREDADIAQVAAALADQLHATVEFLDGALWVHPTPGRPAGPAESTRKPPETAAAKPAETAAAKPTEPEKAGQVDSAVQPSAKAEPEVAATKPAVQAAAAPGEVPAATGESSPPQPETATPADLEKALNKPMVLDRSVGNWQELAARVRQTAGVRCTIQVPGGATYPGLAAEGTIREILEAGRLLGYLTWSVDPPSAKEPGGIRIAVIARG